MPHVTLAAAAWRCHLLELLVFSIAMQSSCATEYSPAQLQALLFGNLDSFPDISTESDPVSSLATEHLTDEEWNDHLDEDTRHLLAAAPAEAGPPIECGNSSTVFTVTVSGNSSDTTCTASPTLLDQGYTTCASIGLAFGAVCGSYLGSLVINVGVVDPVNTVNPDVQNSLAILGFGDLIEVGMLHLNVQGTLSSLNFLPKLQAILGATNPNPGNAFAGAALYLSGASTLDITALPGLAEVTEISGTTIIQSTGLVDLSTGLQALELVGGDLVIEDNTALRSLEGAAQSLLNVTGQVYIANNPLMTSLGGTNETGSLTHIGGKLTIGNNAALTSLAGLDNLEYVGDSITISQNNMLADVSALANYAGCADHPTSQTTPVPLFLQVVVQLQPGAPPITCVMNTFPALCAYIANSGCPNADGTPTVITSGD